jgi:hypothetical protein
MNSENCNYDAKTNLKDNTSYISSLENEIKNLQQTLKVKDEALNCKIEIIIMLEGLIISKCDKDIQTEMVIKLAEIMKKHI